MSNVIQLKNAKARFSGEQIAIEELEELIAIVNGRPEPEWEKDEGLSKVVWWWLDGAVSFGEATCEINFEGGRSAYTWRDFRAVLRILKSLMKKEKTHTFTLYDESDGFDQGERIEVEFMTGELRYLDRAAGLKEVV